LLIARELLEKYMGELLTLPHLMVTAVRAFVLFGGKKLPELGKGLPLNAKISGSPK
jgi:mttA/Hcf106 family